jgi:DHA1 family multidrug resistance protein-like MFS transporter
MPLIAVIIGIIIGSAYVSHYTLTTYLRKFREQGKVVPEDRLPPMIVGAAVLPFGMFWFAWTSSPDMTPWPQILAGVPIGFGIQIITLQNLAYVLDIFTVDANSAVSGTVIVRSLLAGLFPLIAIHMYGNLGVCSPSSSAFPTVQPQSCRLYYLS